MVKITKVKDHDALYKVFIDDVWVGYGYEDTCESLIDELRDSTNAECLWLKNVMM